MEMWLLCVSLVYAIGVITATRIPEQQLEPKPFTAEWVDYINSKPGVLWNAVESKRFKSIRDLQDLVGTLKEPANLRSRDWTTVARDLRNIQLPEAFDARANWPKCTQIGKIRDQSRCGSCWAFASTGTMSDRVCIHSNGTINVDLSVRDLISCCTYCGAGCDGGYSRRAWEYWIKEGIVTGGTFTEQSGCQPYPFSPCDHMTELEQGTTSRYPPCPQYSYSTPDCQMTCVQGYNRTYENDKIFGKSAYDVAADEKQIMAEILLNGPVQASMSVYADFANYRSGIYHHTLHYYVGQHAVRILGWGQQYGTPYWLVANSWNEDWGENGLFRIVRGRDECAIESSILAGLPNV